MSFSENGYWKGKRQIRLEIGESLPTRKPIFLKSKTPLIYDGERGRLEVALPTITRDELVHCKTFPEGDPPQGLTLCFRIPTRIRYNGRYVLELEFHILIRNLLRRISTLSYFYCRSPLELDFRGIISQAEGVSVEETTLRWMDWERFSARQETRMKLRGFVGTIIFRGDIRPFWPFLWPG